MAIFKKNKTTVKSEEKTKKTPAESGAETKSFVGTVSSVVLRPVVTEKSAILASQNSYVFAVAQTANKIEVASAIKSMYGVNPVSVHVQNVRGKYVRRGKVFGRRKGWKKAIVTLPKGKTLNIYEGV